MKKNISKIGKNVKIDPSASIGNRVFIGHNVRIAKGAIVRDNVTIKKNSYIDEYCIIGERIFDYYKKVKYVNPATIIGANSIVRSHSIVYSGCSIGNGFITGHHSIIREYCVIGNNCKFGTASQADGYVKIGNFCQLHSNVFLASYTVLKNHVLFYPYATTLDSLHPPCKKARKGPNFEDYAVVGGGALILPRLNVGREALIAGGAVVTKDVPSRMLVAGFPAREICDIRSIKCKINKVAQPYPWRLNVDE